jgi:hypothetical protein
MAGASSFNGTGTMPSASRRFAPICGTSAKAFATGDFSTPAFVHMRDVPGTKVMTARRALVTYRYAPLPRGGQLRITTSDSAARAAVHQFLAFQRDDHHAAGHAMHTAHPKP